MRVPRIVNRGRIAPSSPRPIIDSGRTSWSSASAVSTIETHSPEPNLSEQVTQRLQESTSMSATKKKLIIGLTTLAVLLLITGVTLGIALPLTLNKSSTTTTTVTTSILTTMSSNAATPSKTFINTSTTTSI